MNSSWTSSLKRLAEFAQLDMRIDQFRLGNFKSQDHLDGIGIQRLFRGSIDRPNPAFDWPHQQMKAGIA
jgi:hypothetical protein